jgi:DNA-binding NarL/FixJ family response regulator
MSLRCLIVDDNVGFLEAAQQLLERQGIDVVGVASTSDDAVQRAHELRPDVALLDIDLGAENGFDIARRLAGEDGLEQLRLVLISMYVENDFADLIEDSPALGFVSKSALSASAIRDVLDSDAADAAA